MCAIPFATVWIHTSCCDSVIATFCSAQACHVWQECGNNAMSSRHSAINKIIRFVFAPTSSSPSVCAQARCFMNRTCQQLNKLSSFRKTSYEFRRLCLRHRRCHHVSAQAHRVRQQRFKNNNEFTPFHQTEQIPPVLSGAILIAAICLSTVTPCMSIARQTI